MTKLKEKPKEKKYFDVVIEAQVPCIIRYKVYADSPEQALEDVKKSEPRHVKHLLHLKRDTISTIYESGSTIVQLIKRWFR